MRHVYLRRGLDVESGQRGGVAEAEGEDYELEIGCNSNASPDMLSLCAHYDEIVEFLVRAESPLAMMLCKSIDAERARLRINLERAV